MAKWSDLELSIGALEQGSPQFKVWPKLRSPELHNYRDIIVALPPSYQSGTGAYPVVVMHDGQNLFDPATSYAGDWGLIDVLRDLGQDGVEALIVAIANKGPFRKYEYSPFRDPVHGGGDGDRYLSFIIEAVLPLVRRSFRTLDGSQHTAMAGSSMGGLLSLYAWWKSPDQFGAAAAISPSAWFDGEALRQMVEQSSAPPGRLWLDIGTAEGDLMVGAVRRLRRALVKAGLSSDDRFRYVEDPGGGHQEQHWGRRFREVLPFLLGRSVGPSVGRTMGKRRM